MVSPHAHRNPQTATPDVDNEKLDTDPSVMLPAFKTQLEQLIKEIKKAAPLKKMTSKAQVADVDGQSNPSFAFHSHFVLV